MFRFEHTAFLWALLLIPFMVIVYMLDKSLEEKGKTAIRRN